jgi:hypothetical protein
MFRLDQFTEVSKLIQASVNGILSMVLLMYAGTVQASFTVLDCVLRENSSYLRIDMETECTQTNSKFRSLFAVSLLSWMLYGVVVPSGILIILHSSWSKFIAFSHPASFKYMFKSLIGQYGSETQSWEAVQLLKKFIQFAIPALSRQPLAQTLMSVLLATCYETLVLVFQPNLIASMNEFESVQNTLVLAILMAGLLFDAKVDGKSLLSEQTQTFLGYMIAAAFMLTIYKLIRSYAEAAMMEAILYRKKVESRWLTTLREVFSSSIKQSLHGMISMLMILRHDVIIKNELQQNMTKQNSMLETVRKIISLMHYVVETVKNFLHLRRRVKQKKNFFCQYSIKILQMILPF